MSNPNQSPLPAGFTAQSATAPILSCADSADWEGEVLRSDEEVWQAMNRVGERLGDGILQEYRQSRFKPENLALLGLIGKGHNGGDALLAISRLVKRGVVQRIHLAFSATLSELKPQTARAYQELQRSAEVAGVVVETIEPGDDHSELSVERVKSRLRALSFDVAIDGLLGMKFKPPVREGTRSLVELCNDHSSIRLRVAVDLPSGVGDEGDSDCHIRADVTFATGIAKSPLLDARWRNSVGVFRYLDIGFFEKNRENDTRVVGDSILDILRRLRDPRSDKRRQGHLAILGGSASMPGALAMATHSALRSGVGLVTVFAPESICSYLAPSAPEAMWQPWPETPHGGLALEGTHLLKERLDTFSALLMGPGMGPERETQVCLEEVAETVSLPCVADADALRPAVLSGLPDGSILTPHAGEFQRILEADVEEGDFDSKLREFSVRSGFVTILKGMNSRIGWRDRLYCNTSGNAVLARGGSGDLLAGLCGGLLAAYPDSPCEVALMAAYWHGRASDELAVAKGQHAVRTTELLDYLSQALQAQA